MSLEISPLTEADVDAFVAIRHEAFEGGVNDIFYDRPVSDETKREIAAYIRKSIREDPTMRFLKVIDTATGELISGVRWIVPPPEGYTAPDDDSGIPKLLPESNVLAWNAFFSMLHDAKEELMGARPCYVLDLLVTHPKHHRRGAAKMLLEWGLEQADREGLETYVEASAMGTPLYSRYGFKTVKELPFDMSKYGGNGVYVHNCMIRLPEVPKEDKSN